MYNNTAGGEAIPSDQKDGGEKNNVRSREHYPHHDHDEGTETAEDQRHSIHCLLPISVEEQGQDGNSNRKYFKTTVILLVSLFLVSITQGVLAWYGTSKISCKKTTSRSATLAPQLMFGIAIAEILFSSVVILVTFTRRLRERLSVCANTRLMVKIVTVCLIAVLLVYLALIGFVELFSEEYKGCDVKRIFLKVQAVLTVVQGCLFIILGNL